MSNERPTYEELEQRLTEAQQIIAALRGGEVDAIITERDVVLLRLKDVENALRKAEENFRNSMENSPLGGRIVTAEGELLYANQAMLDIYGYSSVEELGALPVKQCYTPESYADHQKRKEKRKRGECVPSNYEISVVRKDGEIRFLEVFRKEVLWNGKGHFQLIYHDLTERKRAEEALRQSKENFMALAENASDGILIGTGEEGRHVYANRRAVEITGYPIEDLLKTRFRDLAHPDEIPKLAERYKKRLEGFEVPKPYKTALLNKDGIKVPIEISPSKTIWQDRLADMVIIRDITERKRAEEALRESEATARALISSPVDSILLVNPDGIILDTNQTFAQRMGQRVDELIGRCVYDILPPELAKSRRARVDEVVHFGVPIRFEDERAGMQFDESAHPICDAQGKVTKIAIVARDITDRKETEEALRKSEGEAKRLAEENAVMAEIGRIISSTFDIDTVYERFSMEVRRIVPFDRITINIIDYQKNTFTILYTSGLNMPGRKKGTTISVAGTATEEVIRTRRPLYIQEDEETPKRIPGLLPCFLAGGKSFMFIPMISQDEVIGVLGLLSTQPEAYTEKELRVAEEVGNQIAGAIANAQMFRSISKHREELRALTIRLQNVEEAERRRLAQELHDRVGQNFAALSINLAIIQRELPAESSGKVGARLEDSLKLLKETASHIRNVMAELRPPVLDDYGLLAALQWYGEQFAKRTRVTVVFQGAESTLRLPPPLEAALFRITQEALTNVALHARARQVTVTLEELAQEVRLIIADDGTGFDFSSQSETRSLWGLISMRERAEAIGGRFQVKSAPGEGTRIIVTVRK